MRFRFAWFVLAVLSAVPLSSRTGELILEAPPALVPGLDDPDWVIRAAGADAVGRAAYTPGIQPLTKLLAPGVHPCVQAMALRSLLAFPTEDLWRFGRKELVLAGLALLESKQPYLRKKTATLMTKLASQPLGESPGKWKTWWQEHEPRLALPDLPAGNPKPLPESGFQAFLWDLRRRGLDVVFVVDQGGNMADAFQNSRGKLAALCEGIQRLVPGFRAGLVTYDNFGTVVTVPLSSKFKTLERRWDGIDARSNYQPTRPMGQGIEAALKPKMGWSKAMKVLLVIGRTLPSDPKETCATVEDAQQSGFTLHTISLTDIAGIRRTEEQIRDLEAEVNAIRPVFQKLAGLGKGASVSVGYFGGNGLTEAMLPLCCGKTYEKEFLSFFEVLDAMKGYPDP